MRWPLLALAVLGVLQFGIMVLVDSTSYVSLDMSYLVMWLTLIASGVGYAVGCGYGYCGSWGDGCGCDCCAGCSGDDCCGRCDCCEGPKAKGGEGKGQGAKGREGHSH